MDRSRPTLARRCRRGAVTASKCVSACAPATCGGGARVATDPSTTTSCRSPPSRRAGVGTAVAVGGACLCGASVRAARAARGAGRCRHGSRKGRRAAERRPRGHHAAACRDARGQGAQTRAPRSPATRPPPDMLIDVDTWTGFSECFTHRRTGRVCTDRSSLLPAGGRHQPWPHPQGRHVSRSQPASPRARA